MSPARPRLPILIATVAIVLAFASAAGPARADFGLATVAGTGAGGFGGDGGPATAALLNVPISVTALPGGGFLVAEAAHHPGRRGGPDGPISPGAGNGTSGNSGDGGPATGASLTFPRGVAVTPDGGFL